MLNGPTCLTSSSCCYVLNVFMPKGVFPVPLTHTPSCPKVSYFHFHSGQPLSLLSTMPLTTSFQAIATFFIWPKYFSFQAIVVPHITKLLHFPSYCDFLYDQSTSLSKPLWHLILPKYFNFQGIVMPYMTQVPVSKPLWHFIWPEYLLPRHHAVSKPVLYDKVLQFPRQHAVSEPVFSSMFRCGSLSPSRSMNLHYPTTFLISNCQM